MIAWFPWNCFIRKNKMSFNFSANWIILILVLTILEQNFRSRFKVALEFLLRFGKIGLHKLCHTPPGFITGHYCNADKEALSLQRLSSYKFILLSKGCSCWMLSSFQIFYFFFSKLVFWSSIQKCWHLRDASISAVSNSSKVCKLIKRFP